MESRAVEESKKEDFKKVPKRDLEKRVEKLEFEMRTVMQNLILLKAAYFKKVKK